MSFLSAVSQRWVRNVSEMATNHKITFYHIDMPLPLHQMAFPAAKMLECANPTSYWDTYNALFDSLSQGQLPDHDMQFTGRSDEDLRNCMSRVTIRSDHLQKTFNVSGTPTVLIGSVNPDGSVTLTKQIGGAPTIDQLRREL